MLIRKNLHISSLKPMLWVLSIIALLRCKGILLSTYNMGLAVSSMKDFSTDAKL